MEWHRVVIFNERLADVAERFLRKGRKVYLEGTLQTRKWTDQSGQERYTTEVVIDRFRGELVLLDSNRGGESGDDAGGGGYGGGYSAPSAPRQIGGGRGGSAGGPGGGGAGGGNPGGGWDAPHGGSDLDDEIPF